MLSSRHPLQPTDGAGRSWSVQEKSGSHHQRPRGDSTTKGNNMWVIFAFGLFVVVCILHSKLEKANWVISYITNNNELTADGLQLAARDLNDGRPMREIERMFQKNPERFYKNPKCPTQNSA